MMFSTRTWRNDGSNVRLDDDQMMSALMERIGEIDLLTQEHEQNRGGPIPFSPFGFPAGQPDPFHAHPNQVQPANLQE